MATIKLKYRRSSVKGRNGTLFFQIIHMRQVRQIYTDLHIADDEWNAETATVIIPAGIIPERIKYLSTVKTTLKDWHSKLSAIIEQFDQNGLPYTVEDVVSAYNAPLTIVGLVSFTRELIDDLKKIGKKATVDAIYWRE